ncbi:MAG: imidazole glycerol phosphate synthase subunit HisH, partial [Verrucomicrobiota bacterium]
MIGIVDYESGNLGSVSNACRFLEIEAKIIQRPEELDRCQAMILPGVGAFGDCVDKLAGHGFAEPVVDWIAAGKPFLGICVGLQILFEGSEEAPDSKGLGVLPGMIRKFDVPEEMKVPQIGWNRVRQCRPDCPLFDNIPDESWFYFVHSY